MASETLLASGPAINLYLFRLQDTAWLALGCLLAWLLMTPSINRRIAAMRWLDRLSSPPHPVTLMVAAVLVLGGVGVELVYHAYALSLDEFMARFQAEIFLGGHLLAPLKPEWAGLGRALQPMFMMFDFERGLWGPFYRPLGGAIIAAFDLAGLGRYAHVVLAAGCLPLLAALARRIWPGQPQVPSLAAFLLATSPQFLIAAMTPYAMTAHLFVGLLWLCCFLRGGIGGHLAAALVGFAAVGLHQVHVHPFFVLPFMLSLLKERRLVLAFAYGFWYAAAILFWIFWRDIAVLLAAGGGVSSATGQGAAILRHGVQLLLSHSASDLFYWLANAFRFLAWQNLLLIPLLYLALRAWKQAPWALRMLAWSIVTALLPYLILSPSQGHGWGYRYLHPVLGNFALLAVFGWLQVKAALDRQALREARRLLAALALVAAGVGLPLRALQVERFVAPFAASSAYIAALPHDAALVDGADAWFAVDLVRNDPYLERGPKVLEVNMLSDAELADLCRRHGIAVVDFETLRRFGMTVAPRTPEIRDEARRKLRLRLQDSGCLA